MGKARHAVMGIAVAALAVIAARHAQLGPRALTTSPVGACQVESDPVKPDLIQGLEFAMVTDMDEHSWSAQHNAWISVLQRGLLRRQPHGAFTIEWTSATVLRSHTATNNRSMELSALVRYRRLLLALCDRTGLVFKVAPSTGHILQRFVIADGDGNVPTPFKTEWATVKDGLLWVGSSGKEWTADDGSVLHHNSQWVKTIDENGRIHNWDWRPVYTALREATNHTYPGYLWHEAVEWDAAARQWIFLPRKASREPFHVQADETRGTNLLIVASEDFFDIQVRRVGPLQPEYGFTAVRKVPGTEGVFLALKVKEVQGEVHTVATVLDLHGRLLLEPEPFVHVGDHKFEGLAFID